MSGACTGWADACAARRAPEIAEGDSAGQVGEWLQTFAEHLRRLEADAGLEFALLRLGPERRQAVGKVVAFWTGAGGETATTLLGQVAHRPVDVGEALGAEAGEMNGCMLEHGQRGVTGAAQLGQGGGADAGIRIELIDGNRVQKGDPGPVAEGGFFGPEEGATLLEGMALDGDLPAGRSQELPDAVAPALFRGAGVREVKNDPGSEKNDQEDEHNGKELGHGQSVSVVRRTTRRGESASLSPMLAKSPAAVKDHRAAGQPLSRTTPAHM